MTDTSAEKELLKAILANTDTISEVAEIVSSRDFFAPAHIAIWDTIMEGWDAGKPVDPPILASELDRKGLLNTAGGMTAIMDLALGNPSQATYFAKRVRDQAELRRMAAIGTELKQRAETGTEPDRLREWLDEATVQISKDDSGKVVSVADSIDQVVSELLNPDETPTFPTGFSELDEKIRGGLRGGQMVVIAARPGAGKALALDTKLPTPTGWTTMGDVKVGDELVGMDGLPTTVVATTDEMTERPCYEVEFSDGSVIVADAQHQWITETRKERKNVTESATIKTTEMIAASVRVNKDQRLNHSIRTTKPIALPENDSLLIKPYTLGAWLGDGSSNIAQITSPDQDVLDRIAEDGYIVTDTASELTHGILVPQPPQLKDRTCRYCGRFSPKSYAPTCSDCREIVGTMKGRLRTLGVLNNKHIPKEYLRASESQRRDLLAGLLDTDGTVTKAGGTQICLTWKPLVDGVMELIASLGYRPVCSTKRVKGRIEETSTAYTIMFTTDDEVFQMNRKKETHKERLTNYTPARNLNRYIVRADKIDSVPVKCVQVDNKSHTYLAGDMMIPTHNSTLAVDIMREGCLRHGKNALFFSLEMSRKELLTRIMSAEHNVNTRDFDSRNVSPEKMAEMAESLKFGGQMMIDDSPNMTMTDIRAKAKQINKRIPLGLICIDYLQLLSSNDTKAPRQEQVSQMSRQIKLLAKELDVPIIAVAQLNRESEKRDNPVPKVSDLRESGAIEQDMDVGLLLHRPDSSDPDHARAGECDIIIGKQRGGQVGTVTVASQLHYSRFTDPPKFDTTVPDVVQWSPTDNI